MNKKVKNGIKLGGIAIMTAFAITVTALCATVFDRPLRTFVGEVGSADNTAENSENTNSYIYNSTSYKKDTLLAAKQAMGEEITAEGIVLLKKGDALPYAKGTTFSFFGRGSREWQGTGSLQTVFENEGFNVNSTLTDFYSSGAGKNYKLGSGSINYGDAMDYSINECPLSVLRDNNVLDSAKGTVPVFVVNRKCGEGVDPARGMYSGTDTVADWDKSYQELNSEELEILQYLNDNFNDVVVIINSGNAMELGWAETMTNVHSIIQIPSTGATGINSLPRVFSGDVNPSGRLVDTYVYDLFSAPATQNIGDMQYYSNGQPTGYYYVAYKEGIYVGYKYYETRYEDYVLGQGNVGDYDYAATVQFPFGYGLSYSEFEWSGYECTYDDATETFDVKVTVTNKSEKAGKEVVQIYAQSPYTDYDKENGVEKSAVNLVGFAKTKELAKGDSETVEVTFGREQLKSYDSNKAKTYILEAGDYFVTAASDAHTAANNILMAKDLTEPQLARINGEGSADFVTSFDENDLSFEVESNGVNKTLYSNDTTTGVEITNQFDFATQSDITYLSRNDWKGTYPTVYGETSDQISDWGNAVNGKDSNGNPVGYQWKKEVSSDVLNQIKLIGKEASLNPDTATYDMATFSANNGVELIDLRGKAYDDPLWEDLLDNLSADDITLLITQSGYGSSVIESINKPAGNDRDGASGLVLTKAMSSMPSTVFLAQSFNSDLAYRYGQLVGEDGLQGGQVTGWYAPSMNIHRTAFSARVNEYYSEDPFLSGVIAAGTVRGASDKGLYAFIKHFALNDQDLHRGDREGENGLVTWANEQSIRELYLVPFEACIKQDTVSQYYYAQDGNGEFVKTDYELPACTAIMTSFNRIGATWAGGCYNLITGVLKNEWGFGGFIITDFDNGGYMNAEQMIYAGGSTKLCTLNSDGYSLNTGDAMEVHYAREAVHGILYTMTNSYSMNGIVHGVAVSKAFPYYGFILIGLWVLWAAGTACLVWSIFRKKKSKNTEAV